MVCFSCKPDWFRYVLLEDDGLSLPAVARVNVAESVCLELWASCTAFGRSVVALGAAVRDSSVARAAPVSLESLDMFADRQELCEWTQREVALHPFKLLSREDDDVPDGAKVAALVAARTGNSSAGSLAFRRRLEHAGEQLDVLKEGRRTGFDLAWRSPTAAASCAASRTLGPAVLAAVGLLLAWGG
mmetsp:Transcript_103031/g.321077  ORF Transcript_103031/g.321077 Transcript_103031/m.321077 type:complete len:187 (+) Transcript_103031:505-1065(+)